MTTITIGAKVKTGDHRAKSAENMHFVTLVDGEYITTQPESHILNLANVNRVGVVKERVENSVYWRIEFPDGTTDTFAEWDLTVLENL